MARVAPRFALWLLLGFVLGGVLAPAWHTAHHGPASLAHADPAPTTQQTDGASLLTGEEKAVHPLACALCAVPLSWTPPPTLQTLHALVTVDAVSPWPSPRASASVTVPHDPRGPPALC